jgi:hypothetical protein
LGRIKDNGFGYDFGVENPVGFFMLESSQVKCTEYCFWHLGNAEL